MVDVGSFRIDLDETSHEALRAFRLVNPGLSLRPGVCQDERADPPQFKADGAAPMVDWCSAHTYCRWAGKRLCGAIGGGRSNPKAAGDATVDMWAAACDGTGIHHLAGDAEWIDACDTFEPERCAVRGVEANGTSACLATQIISRRSLAAFRCCAP